LLLCLLHLLLRLLGGGLLLLELLFGLLRRVFLILGALFRGSSLLASLVGLLLGLLRGRLLIGLNLLAVRGLLLHSLLRLLRCGRRGESCSLRLLRLLLRTTASGFRLFRLLRLSLRLRLSVLCLASLLLGVGFCPGGPFLNSKGPGRWSGQSGKELVWLRHFCILRWSDRQWK